MDSDAATIAVLMIAASLLLLLVLVVLQFKTLQGVTTMGVNQDRIAAAIGTIQGDVAAIAAEIKALSAAADGDATLADLATRAEAAATALDALKPAAPTT